MLRPPLVNQDEEDSEDEGGEGEGEEEKPPSPLVDKTPSREHCSQCSGPLASDSQSSQAAFVAAAMEEAIIASTASSVMPSFWKWAWLGVATRVLEPAASA